jgi:hypothetical protein
MTAPEDKAGDIGIGVAEDAGSGVVEQDGGCATSEQELRRDAVTREVCRGVCRLMRDLGHACIAEMPLPNGRRADVVALAQNGDLWIVEVKSSVEDFRTDHKWPEYRDFSDALYFAVAPAFPVELLPADAGLILADRYGGEVVRAAPETRLAPARRKAMTLRFAHCAALTLQAVLDPALKIS